MRFIRILKMTSRYRELHGRMRVAVQFCWGAILVLTLSVMLVIALLVSEDGGSFFDLARLCLGFLNTALFAWLGYTNSFGMPNLEDYE